MICAAGMSSRLIGACPRSAGSTAISPGSASADACTLLFLTPARLTCCAPTCCATARLTGELQSDRATILRALAAGRAWLTCPFVAPAHGSRVWAERADGQMIQLGAEAPAGRAQLRVRLPRAAEIMVIRDGVPLHWMHGATLDVGLELPGVYRVEALIDGRLWLLSNPIYLRAM
jgi:hypothetical protein